MNEKQKREAFVKVVRSTRILPGTATNDGIIKHFDAAWAAWQDGYEHGLKAANMPPNNIELPETSYKCQWRGCQHSTPANKLKWRNDMKIWVCTWHGGSYPEHTISLADWLEQNGK